jgi:hypothetical protein
MRLTVGVVRSSGTTSLPFVAAVPEREPPGRPLALFRAAFDSGSDAVNDRGVLELRKHGQHPGQRPARWCGEIQGLVQRDKAHP